MAAHNTNDVATPYTKHSPPVTDLDNVGEKEYNQNKTEIIGSDENGEEIDKRGTEERNNSSNKAAQRKSSDRPGVQERVGKTQSRLREDSSPGRRH